MGKKRQDNKPKPTRSFDQMVASESIERLKPYVRQEMQNVEQQINQRYRETFSQMFTRIVVLEKLLMEKFELSEDDLAERVCIVEDTQSGLEVAETSQEGDVVRVTVSTKAKDQAEFQGTSRHVIESLGAGKALGLELEGKLIGLKVGGVAEMEFGEDKSMIAKIVVNRVSRKIEVESLTEEVKSDENQDAGK